MTIEQKAFLHLLRTKKLKGTITKRELAQLKVMNTFVIQNRINALKSDLRRI